MLSHLSIQNLAVVEHLEFDLKSGMTVLTGETGAGKSILMDALGLTLGNRAESGLVRHGCVSAEISAIYDLTHLPRVASWLQEQDLEAQNECVIRRSITEEGRSRAIINGRMVPLTQLKALGEQLIHIHGQHQHQTLLKPDCQRELLDDFANHPDLCLQVKHAYESWYRLRKEQIELLNLESDNDKLALLNYQIQEIDELNLQPNELSLLDTEHKQLANAEHWIMLCETAYSSLQNDTGEDVFSRIQHALTQINSLKTQTPKVANIYELLSNGLIQLQEAASELQHFKEKLNLDPNRLATLDQRLSQIHTLARKHRIQPEALFEHRETLYQTAQKLSDRQAHLSVLSEKIKAAELSYQKNSDVLSNSRQKSALELENLITKSLKTLEMPNGHLKIQFSKKNVSVFSPQGIDDIEFLVSTNPGIPLQPLRKIASGGELSRISLAIQVITAQKMTTPTLIFDEVDVGISGKTAEIVGSLMRTLGNTTQVLCVTHLPQVAAQGHSHYRVEKHQKESSTTTTLTALDKAGKIQELARMLGGITITKQARLHAETMLKHVEVA